MKRFFQVALLVLSSLTLLFNPRAARGDSGSLDGKWELVRDRSTDIDLYGTLSVESGHRVRI